jgi:hypothetical protein
MHRWFLLLVCPSVAQNNVDPRTLRVVVPYANILSFKEAPGEERLPGQSCLKGA